jgi:hypothetical protein
LARSQHLSKHLGNKCAYGRVLNHPSKENAPSTKRGVVLLFVNSHQELTG